jgi:hypothetical protein
MIEGIQYVGRDGKPLAAATFVSDLQWHAFCDVDTGSRRPKQNGRGFQFFKSTIILPIVMVQ